MRPTTTFTNRNKRTHCNSNKLLSSSSSQQGLVKLCFLFLMVFYAGYQTHVLFSSSDSYELLSSTIDYSSLVTSSSIESATTTTTTSKETNHDDTIHSNFQLAFDQSMGFFDNIAEDDWKRYQQRATERINHARKFGIHNPLQFYNWEPARWYMNNFEPDFTCAHERRVIGPGDGPKWVCDPHRLPRVAKRRGTPCLIYSIGSGGKWEFEDGMHELLLQKEEEEEEHCEIHVFDPGNFAKLRTSEEMEGRNIHFHHWGLKSSYDDSYTPNVDYGKFLTLQETLKELNHVGRVIDIFKIDCEFCEWHSWKDWTDPSIVDIRQLLIETHDLPTNPIMGLDYFYGLQQAGFYLFHKEPNIHPRALGNGIEWAYIKLSADFYTGGDIIPSYNRTFVLESGVYESFKKASKSKSK